MKDALTIIAEKQRHPRKPIKFWVAYEWKPLPRLNMTEIDRNNSIAILRARYGNSVIYKAIR